MSISRSSAVLKDIDSLPYHALQAEAAKHSIRRNLGASKLRDALKELLGNNPNPTNLPPQWFIASTNPAAPKAHQVLISCPTRPLKTNSRIKSAARNLPRAPPLPRAPRSPQPRRTKNPSITSLPAPSSPPSCPPEPPSQPQNLSDERHSPTPAELNNHQSLAESNPPTQTNPRPIDNPPASSPQLTKHNPSKIQTDCKPTSERGSPVPHDQLPRSPLTASASSCNLLPQAIRDEALRLGLTTNYDEQTIEFLTRLVRDTLQEVGRGNHVLCLLQAHSKPITHLTPRFLSSPRTKIYGQDPRECTDSIAPLPSPTQPPPLSPSSKGASADETAKSQSEIGTGIGPSHRPMFYVSTPADTRAFQPPRIALPSPSKTLDPAFGHRTLHPHLLHSHPISHPDHSSSSLADATFPPQPAHFLPPSPTAPAPVSPAPVHTPPKPGLGPSAIPPGPSPALYTAKDTPLRHKAREGPATSPDEADCTRPEQPSGRPKKKTKLGSPTGRAGEARVPGSPAASPPAPIHALRLTRSPAKGPLAAHPPSPLSSPAAPASNPTLFGTEHFYGDSSAARFGEMFLYGSDRLLPSPLLQHLRRPR